LPAAVERTYDLWLWLDARVADFPVHARHGIGRRMLDTVLDLLAALLRAAYAPRGTDRLCAALDSANEHAALLRLLLRGARERRYLAVGQYEHAAERLVEIGKMAGAWRKRARALE
jgi:hypothetical protein